MKKRLVTAMVMAGALALGACQDEVMDEWSEDTSLTHPAGDQDDDHDEGPAGDEEVG